MTRLTALAAALGAVHVGRDVEVTGIAVDSREVRPGDLFVAFRGSTLQGLDFLPEARRRGAVALCAEQADDGLPTLLVSEPRAAVARLAAEIHGHPARALHLIGITGTLGKTSTALLVQSALEASGVGVGVIGSLGVRIRGRVRETGMTTPDAPTIHRALRAMADAGVRLAALEVTSHALALGRVEGLAFALGVFTNLVPDEHLEFHGTPDEYLRTKLRFLDLLGPAAPLVYNADDARVAEAVARDGIRRPRPLVPVSLRQAAGAAVILRGLRADAAGSAFALEILRPLPTIEGGEVGPQLVPLVLPVFGLQQVANAALAAASALVAGATPLGVTESVAEIAPIRRRMELVRQASPAMLDDTAGNPRTLRAVFESIRVIPHRGLRIAFGIRGARGAAINTRLACTLAELVRARADDSALQLVVTASEDSAGPRDRVTDEERDAVTAALRGAGIPFTYEPTLHDAIRRVLDHHRADDLILILGAQGMDRAAQIAGSLLP